ncbi:hypothetical protein [Serratia fonticola]|uniref:hypothetical protein n=1 Tax=Serratia fonticola TaxID=47917 RepID=UPI0003A6C12F
MAQAIGFNPFAKIGQVTVYLRKGIFGVLCQRSGQILRVIFGNLQVALMSVPDLLGVEHDQGKHDDNNEHASLIE